MNPKQELELNREIITKEHELTDEELIKAWERNNLLTTQDDLIIVLWFIGLTILWQISKMASLVLGITYILYLIWLGNDYIRLNKKLKEKMQDRGYL